MPVTFFVPGCFPATTGAIVFDKRLGEELRALGHSVTLVQVGGRHPLPDAAAVEAAAAAWKEHERQNPAGVAVIDGFCLYAFAPLAGTLRDAGAIGLVHHLMSLEPQLAPPERERFAEIERAVLPRLARIVVPSESTRSRLAEALPLPESAVAVVTPGIPMAERSTGSGGPGCHLLAVGSLIPRKGYDTVLRALAGLRDLDWTLTICGDPALDPEHAAALRALAEQAGILEAVTFAGPCAAERMERLWRTADIFVSGSRFEGYGMAVAEAVRRGLPLALTSGAAVTELIPMEASVVVDPGDHVQLSKALRRIIFSRPLRQGLADAAWQAGRALPDWPDQARHFARLLPAQADGR